MKLVRSSEYAIMWEAFGVLFEFIPPHNYMTGEVLPESDPRCDMPAIMMANPETLRPIFKCSERYEVGLNVIVDF